MDLAIKETRDQIVEFCRSGRAVKVEGLGIFTPTIDLREAGYRAISFRADAAINYNLNMPGTFTGTILNREFIGKSSAELVAKWNEAYPEDQVAAS